MTYKQAADQSWQIRRGEKGTQIEFWDVRGDKGRGARDVEGTDGSRAARDPNDDRPRLVHRVYTVFNAAQIDGIPAHVPRQHSAFEVVQAGERILTASGAKIAHDQANSAFYSRTEDAIHLPQKGAFKDAAGYFGTALHELAHWSGHPSRLNRPTLNESYRFGDVNYAKEELRAELASVFLAAERGIPHDSEQHAAYVGSWIKSLKEDKNEIFRAAHDASVATDFLLSLERERSMAEEALATAQERSATAGLSSEATLEEETAEIHCDRRRLEDLDPATDIPSLTETQPTARQQTQRLADELGIAVKALGDSAKVHAARTEGGTYRGTIIGETAAHVVQRESGQSAVTHPKELLDRQPQVGETVRINYSNSRGQVREAQERSKHQELGR
jgi:antirestriction protein ArdC